MTTSERRSPKSWLSQRTTLESGLLWACIGLTGIIVALCCALQVKTAPLEADWGNIADWAGAVVTFGGFVGAILAVRVQTRAVSIQTAQRKDELDDRATADAAAASAEALRRDAHHKRFAHAVTFDVSAKHDRGLPGHRSALDGQLVFRCRADFPGDAFEPYSDCRIIIPEPLPQEVALFNVTIARVSESNLGSSGYRSNLTWRATGNGWFSADDRKAFKWFAPLVALEFTDPEGIRWRINGNQQLSEI
ncbi:hypothetical protein [Paenarthrobacter sp. NPDC058040]|uniref:hypothetical protein n=1 Tax=unclassified Paenarthrobacter TaxID=2634190 RepID=UPI0036DBA0F4